MSHRKTLASNFGALTAMQVSLMVLPLIAVPYLVRVIGIEKFGLVSFAQAIMYFLGSIGDCGINLYGAQFIAKNRDDQNCLRKFFWSANWTRMGFLVLISALMIPVFLLVPRFEKDFAFYMASLFYLSSLVLLPTWFFQGLERMKTLAVVTVLARSLPILLLFVFIHSPDDYWIVPLLQGGVPTLVLILVLMKTAIQFNFFPLRFSLLDIQETFTKAFPLLVSNASVGLYTTLTPIILGAVTNNTAVGFYTAASKPIQALLSIFAQGSNTLYPFIARHLSTQRDFARSAILQSFALFMILGIYFALVFYGYSVPLISILYGEHIREINLVFQILCLLIMIIPINSILGGQVLLTHEKFKDVSIIVSAAGVLNILSCLVLTTYWKEVGAAWSWVVAEAFVAALFWKKAYHLGFIKYSKAFVLKCLLILACLGTSIVLLQEKVAWFIGFPLSFAALWASLTIFGNFDIKKWKFNLK